LNFVNLYAASLSTLISFVLLFIYRYILIKKIVILRFRFGYFFAQMFIYLISCIAYISGSYLFVFFGLFLNLLICLSFFVKYKIKIMNFFK
jgi:hypothetical protein